MRTLLLLACGLAAVYAQQNYRTTPVPILRQINRHNDDGSYSYGYEGADGSFKIETKYPSGEVKGKYGYIGDDGKKREIEYGASNRGFEPAGSDINVPPPTLVNSRGGNSLDDGDDGQYREDPSIYYAATYPKRTSSNRQSSPSTYSYNAPALPAPSPAPAPAPAPHTFYNHALPAQPNYRRYDPVPAPHIYNSQPATNLNLRTGSYSLSYSG